MKRARSKWFTPGVPRVAWFSSMATALIGVIGPLFVLVPQASAVSTGGSTYSANGVNVSVSFVDASHIGVTASGTLTFNDGGTEKVDFSKLTGIYYGSSISPYVGDHFDPTGKYWFENNQQNTGGSGGCNTDVDILSYNSSTGAAKIRINPHLAATTGSAVSVGTCRKVVFPNGGGNSIDMSIANAGTGQNQNIFDANDTGYPSSSRNTSNVPPSMIQFYQNGSGEIDTSTIDSNFGTGGNGLYIFKQEPGSNSLYQEQGSSAGCSSRDTISITSGAGNTVGQFELGRYTYYDNNCHTHSYTIAILGQSPESTFQANTGATLPGCQGGATDANGNCSAAASNITVCESNSGALGWIICPLLNLIVATLEKMATFIGNTLDIQVEPIFDQTNCSSNCASKDFFTAEKNFEIFAQAALLIAGLLVVVAQSLGLEIFSAHTVRKFFPRLIFAIVVIALWWEIARLIVSFFDTAGVDIRGIITGPFQSFGASVTGGTGVLLGVLGTAAIITYGMASLTFLGTALLAVFAGYLMLVFRQAALDLLIIAGPLWVALYALPGTEGFSKLALKTFIALNMLFLAFEAFNGAVSDAQVVLLKGGGEAAQLEALALEVVKDLGFVAIATRIGGVTGQLAGFVNDRHKGAFDRLRNIRSSTSQKNFRDLKAGSRYNPNNRMSRYLGGTLVNRVGAHAGAGMGGRFGFGTTGRAVRGANARATVDELRKENKVFDSNWANEDVMMAVASGNDGQFLSRMSYFQNPNGTANWDKINYAVAMGRAIGSDQRTQTAAFQAVAMNGKGINTREERKALANRIGRGNRTFATTIDEDFKYVSRSQAGRNDLGRDSWYDTVHEMDLHAVSKLKPRAAQNIYWDDKNGESNWMRAVNQAGISQAERDHMYDVLYAAQYNSSLSPEVHAAMARTISRINGSSAWTGAANRYSSKFQSGGGTTTPPPPSDIRLKHAIIPLGYYNDIKIYRFKYLWSEQEYVGVMAQDLLQSHPEALSFDALGFYHVDYDVLGLRMMTLQEWERDQLLSSPALVKYQA